MKKYFQCVLVVSCFLILTGCRTTTNQTQSKPSNVDISNGVDSSEALEIAREILIHDQRQRVAFKADQPKIMDDFLAREYSDYWFVSFPPRNFNDSFYDYLVVINKETGKLKFMDSYVPLKTTSFDWIFSK